MTLKPSTFRSEHSIGWAWKNHHLILYRWGFTLRRRSGPQYREQWKHYRLNVWDRKPGMPTTPSNPNGVLRIFEASTWRSKPGVQDRVLGTKRYIRFQVCLHETAIEGQERYGRRSKQRGRGR